MLKLRFKAEQNHSNNSLLFRLLQSGFQAIYKHEDDQYEICNLHLQKAYCVFADACSLFIFSYYFLLIGLLRTKDSYICPMVILLSSCLVATSYVKTWRLQRIVCNVDSKKDTDICISADGLVDVDHGSYNSVCQKFSWGNQDQDRASLYLSHTAI